MPPKKQQAPSKKAIQKEQKRIIEDKTFGLKNKNKSKKVQTYMKSVANRVQAVDKRTLEEERRKKEEKLKADLEKKEIASLFKPAVVQPKVPPGVDPKSFVCEFFKAGQCTKGDKCKFSHDLGVGRRAEKMDIYTDQRNLEDSTMENWDQKELEHVVEEKQGDVNRNLKTKIVCKYFLDAVEQRKYGWFWECPNGSSCQYVHALPPGFVLKKKEVKKDEEEEEEPIEVQIEDARAKLPPGAPVLTRETFEEWKKKKELAKAETTKKEQERRKTEIAAGRAMLSGRELLVYNPNVFVDEDDSLASSDLVMQTTEEFDRFQTVCL
eukprot:TRINITY_DN5577_c0_g1_i2.p1 TRINITY_DN5577_c0_g1~~TRINITY_DN5577_c0_g1_i2.p1  ORF type:complete len:338 (-),score=131.81 TRINITY_DN5577_c0_g1_i2:1085-2053(-)